MFRKKKKKKEVSGESKSRLASRASQSHLLPHPLKLPADSMLQPRGTDRQGSKVFRLPLSPEPTQVLAAPGGRFSAGARPAAECRPGFGAGCGHIVFLQLLSFKQDLVSWRERRVPSEHTRCCEQGQRVL